MNFWTKLTKPFTVLAPMEDVTDTVFRQIVAKCGKPDVFFTEFTNVDGLFSKGREKVAQRLKFADIEKPIVAQIWGLTPENFYKAGKLLNKLNFDGIDINMGCPQKNVTKKGACSALINNQPLAKEIISATIEGAGKLPVSIKTRVGFKKIQTEEWISFLLGFPIAALTVHGRIASEMSRKPANWEEIGKAVEIRNRMKSQTLIIGNGDVISYKDAVEKAGKYKADGIMIGRGIFEDLWIFDQKKKEITFKKKLMMLKKHIFLFQTIWEGKRDFNMLKKFYKIYIREIPEASEIRGKLVRFKTLDETIQYIEKLLTL
ncbi:MAG: tRNA-dihydrouridine synthase [Candidatus Gottesmanbacteria bacterium GW2011_GWC2_39_8]|uniref:tRNA-dihydrouridine synthase n=1 Tax=Candidatus Gottesmanbacteria bacterium GW2011_GWC2_39_8 TaxID=1618450 RepID=A0A0G0SHR8_9BACT|nr:MAG: tRNA-dihydrouridine synthase [Candidatus Gottesmanbacteria bacterium GW2011_GWC2_39_8]